VIPINREILEHGTSEQRKAHIAEVVAEFLDSNFFSVGLNPFLADSPDKPADVGDTDDDLDLDDLPDVNIGPISDAEFEHWVRFELQKLDDPSYFKKHFG